MIDSYLFEYFIAFLEEGSTPKVSEKLHISQPSVTRALQKLEDELNLPLFDRKPNKMTLNENGIILSEYIKDAVSIDKRIREKADELRKKAITVRIYMTAPGPTFKYPNFFYFHKESNPNNIEIKSDEECLNGVVSGLCDVAFINDELCSIDGLHKEKVFDERLYVSLPTNHFLSKKTQGVTFNELDGQSFLIARDLGIWDKVIDLHLKKSKFFRQDNESLREIVSASSIPSFATNITLKYRDDMTRVFIPILDEDATKPFYAICKKEKIDILNKIKTTA